MSQKNTIITLKHIHCQSYGNILLEAGLVDSHELETILKMKKKNVTPVQVIKNR